MPLSTMFLNIVRIFILAIIIPGQDAGSVVQKKLSELCTCSEIYNVEKTYLILNIHCSENDRKNHITDLDKIEWPPNPNGLKISATFEDMRLSTVGK